MTRERSHEGKMIEHRSSFRVRYADTDAMSVVYYSRYFEYFEVGRTELLRACGLPYTTLEAMGFLLPVTKASAEYFKGARYDEMLTIVVRMSAEPSPRLEITYDLLNEAQELLARGATTLAFVDRATGRPTRPPQAYHDALRNFERLNHSVVSATSGK